MKPLRAVFATFVVAAANSMAPAHSSQDNVKPAPAVHPAGARDFDFLIGEWRVQHRRLKERLAGSQEWVEFDGTCSFRTIMDGMANVDDNVLNLPTGVYRAASIRAYDASTGLWAIWWLDGRSPAGPLDPPVKGRFENGVGTFYSDDTLRGKPIRVRYTWSRITATSARWEQAFSPDAGQTWETNWVMEFHRTSSAAGSTTVSSAFNPDSSERTGTADDRIDRGSLPNLGRTRWLRL